MNIDGVKSGAKKFFSECAQELREKLIWMMKVTLIALVVYVALVVVFLALPTSWQEGISANAKAASDYLSSVLTSDRMKRFDHWFHIFFVGIFFGTLIWAASATLLAIAVAGIMIIFKIEKIENHRLSAMTSLSICVFPIIVAYIAVTNQPVLGVIEKIAKFLDH